MARAPAADAGRWGALTALVGDPTRLRMLRLLDREELGVGELARILQLPQSTVSRHLKLLLDAGWAQRRHQGTAGLYRADAAPLDATAAALRSLALGQVDASQAASDEARLAGVLAERRTDSREFFGRVAGEWDSLRRELFGSAFTVEGLLSLLDPEWAVADLGCGTGDVAELMAPLVRRVIAVDREPLMLDAAKRRLAGHRNVIFRRGELTELPIRAGEIDAAVAMLVLHHLDDPAAALHSSARALAPGGRLLVVDMVRHDRQEYARTMGHRHLGFSERDARGWAKESGLALRRWLPLRPDPDSKGPGLFAALFTAPAGERHSRMRTS